MSRIGKKPITIKETVNVKLEGKQIIVSGSKGTLKHTLSDDLSLEIKEGQIILTNKKPDNPKSRSMYGFTRSLLSNMVEGVEKGFSRILKIVGTGYRVKLEGNKLVLSLGFSHPVVIEAPEGIQFEVEGNDTIKVLGIDKQLVGQTAARIRSFYPPEPYKGKGIRYLEEKPRRKPGKAGKAGVASGGGK